MNNERFFVDKVSVSLSVASSLRVLLFYAFGVKPWGTGETKSGKSFFVFRFRFGGGAAERLATARTNTSRKRTLKRLSDVTLGCNAFDLEMHCGESNCGIARLDGRDEIQSWNYGESGNVPSVPGFPGFPGFRFFAQNAKDGAPTRLVMPARSKAWATRPGSAAYTGTSPAP